MPHRLWAGLGVSAKLSVSIVMGALLVALATVVIVVERMNHAAMGAANQRLEGEAALQAHLLKREVDGVLLAAEILRDVVIASASSPFAEARRRDRLLGKALALARHNPYLLRLSVYAQESASEPNVEIFRVARDASQRLFVARTPEELAGFNPTPISALLQADLGSQDVYLSGFIETSANDAAWPTPQTVLLRAISHWQSQGQQGHVVVDLDAQEIFRFISSQVVSDDHMAIYAEGKLIYASSSDFGLGAVEARYQSSASPTPMVSAEHHLPGWPADKRFTLYVAMRDLGLSQSVQLIGAQILAALLVLLVAAAAFGVFVSRKILGPLVRMTRKLESEPDQGSVLDTDGLSMEPLALANTVNIMTAKIETHLDSLHRQNQTLEQFAYIASHDLQEPVRTISSYCDVLVEDFGIKLSSGQKELLGRLSEASRRLTLLVSGLMDYASLGREAEECAVDLNGAMQGVLKDLDQRLQAVRAQVHVETLPTVWGSPLELRSLLHNLISNAIKFADPDRPLRLKIRTRSTAEFHTIVFEDNGIGIESRYRERVFQIFQTLNRRGAYEGVGIGLAHCKKIVELHGGSIRIDEPGEGCGTIFTVRLPWRERESLQRSAVG